MSNSSQDTVKKVVLEFRNSEIQPPLPVCCVRDAISGIYIALDHTVVRSIETLDTVPWDL
jgi:hypothetical protein